MSCAFSANYAEIILHCLHIILTAKYIDNEIDAIKRNECFIIYNIYSR